MAWLKVEGFDMVNNKSFTLLRSPNWNWLMSVTSSHEMSQANYLKSDAYITTKHDPWQRDRNLVVDMCSLSKFPNMAQNSSKNVSNHWISMIGVPTKVPNQARAMFDNRVSKNPTWVGLIKYWWRWNQKTRGTWLIKPRNFNREPSNLSKKLITTPLVGVGSWKHILKMSKFDCLEMSNGFTKCLIFFL
jgi:hypothetical protein